jgi:hypothetical protein
MSDGVVEVVVQTAKVEVLSPNASVFDQFGNNTAVVEVVSAGPPGPVGPQGPSGEATIDNASLDGGNF